MQVYVLVGSQGVYSDNTTWVEGVFDSTELAIRYVRDRPLETGKTRRVVNSEFAPIEADEWFNGSIKRSNGSNKRWRGNTQDHICAPGDETERRWNGGPYCNHYDGDVDWTIEEWPVSVGDK